MESRWQTRGLRALACALVQISDKVSEGCVSAALCETLRLWNHCAKVQMYGYNSITSILIFAQYTKHCYFAAKLYILYKLNK